MDNEVKCKKLSAIFKKQDACLRYSHGCDFYTSDGLHIQIKQYKEREIIIEAEEEKKVCDMYLSLTYVEQLLMLLGGKFVPIKELQLSKFESATDADLTKKANELIETRLPYYESADFCIRFSDEWVKFESVITPELYDKWLKLLDDLDIVHQVYMYSLSASEKMADVRYAFLAELAEPLMEIVKLYTKSFVSLTPGEKGTTLKNCLDVLISKYGETIFKAESGEKYEKLLKRMVDSRVRIMHIKRNQKGNYFDGLESIVYSLKMAFLYRRIMFELLGIKEEIYIKEMEESVKSVEKWKKEREEAAKKEKEEATKKESSLKITK